MWDADSDWSGVDLLHLPYADEESMMSALRAICGWAQRNSHRSPESTRTGRRFRIRFTNDLLFLPPNRVKQCMVEIAPELGGILRGRMAAEEVATPPEGIIDSFAWVDRDA